ncbi:hypothetical protein, partial [Angelakisella massiliensis]|uniref:hypothetical protein n=1 Tax=Angelakisella massiliensis TaxID=1871018 RepID=UPI0024B07A6B
AGKARNTKENRRSKEFNTVSRQPVALPSSPRDNLLFLWNFPAGLRACGFFFLPYFAAEAGITLAEYCYIM